MTRFTPAPGRGVRGLAVAAALGLVLYVVQAALPAVCGPALTGLADDVLYPGLILAAAVLCGVRAAGHAPDRAAWAAMAAGLGLWAAAEVVYAIALAPLAEPPLPSVSDGLWLAFFPCAYVTIVLLVRDRARRFSRGLWLDGLIGALATAAAGVALLYGPIAAAGGDATAVALDLAYLLADVLLVGFALAAALLVRGGGRAFGLLLGALALAGAGDAFTLYEGAAGLGLTTTVPEAVTPLALLLVAAAAWAPVRIGPAATLGGWRSIAGPVGFGSLALAVLVVVSHRHQSTVAVTLSAAALAVALARLAVTFGENLRLLRATQREATTDALTGLGNRRKLMADLDALVETGGPDRPWALLLFDLDGFKGYNDAFGHPAGDSLLARLGSRFAAALPAGCAYRLGGDEFCALLPSSEPGTSVAVSACIAALTEHGEGFAVGTSAGRVALPEETADVSEAMQIADRRLYAQKGERQRESVSTQTGRVLLQAVLEREPTLRGHVERVAELAVSVGRELGLGPEDLAGIARAAQLHDVGKMAVPDAILHKPGPLDDAEWRFMQQHSIVGERILRAAPALQEVAGLVRASHEHFDGSGYPDGLAGEEIPLGARIVAVCDAFHAMTSERPYSPASSIVTALEELRRCAGSQFDPEVVERFCAVVTRPAAARRPHRGPRRAAAASPRG